MVQAPKQVNYSQYVSRPVAPERLTPPAAPSAPKLPTLSSLGSSVNEHYQQYNTTNTVKDLPSYWSDTHDSSQTNSLLDVLLTGKGGSELWSRLVKEPIANKDWKALIHNNFVNLTEILDYGSNIVKAVLPRNWTTAKEYENTDTVGERLRGALGVDGYRNSYLMDVDINNDGSTNLLESGINLIGEIASDPATWFGAINATKFSKKFTQENVNFFKDLASKTDDKTFKAFSDIFEKTSKVYKSQVAPHLLNLDKDAFIKGLERYKTIINKSVKGSLPQSYFDELSKIAVNQFDFFKASMQGAKDIKILQGTEALMDSFKAAKYTRAFNKFQKGVNAVAGMPLFTPLVYAVKNSKAISNYINKFFIEHSMNPNNPFGVTLSKVPEEYSKFKSAGLALEKVVPNVVRYGDEILFNAFTKNSLETQVLALHKQVTDLVYSINWNDSISAEEGLKTLDDTLSVMTGKQIKTFKEYNDLFHQVCKDHPKVQDMLGIQDIDANQKLFDNIVSISRERIKDAKLHYEFEAVKENVSNGVFPLDIIIESVEGGTFKRYANLVNGKYRTVNPIGAFKKAETMTISFIEELTKVYNKYFSDDAIDNTSDIKQLNEAVNTFIKYNDPNSKVIVTVDDIDNASETLRNISEKYHSYYNIISDRSEEIDVSFEDISAIQNIIKNSTSSSEAYIVMSELAKKYGVKTRNINTSDNPPKEVKKVLNKISRALSELEKIDSSLKGDILIPLDYWVSIVSWIRYVDSYVSKRIERLEPIVENQRLQQKRGKKDKRTIANYDIVNTKYPSTLESKILRKLNRIQTNLNLVDPERNPGIWKVIDEDLTKTAVSKIIIARAVNTQKHFHNTFADRLLSLISPTSDFYKRYFDKSINLSKRVHYKTLAPMFSELLNYIYNIEDVRNELLYINGIFGGNPIKSSTLIDTLHDFDTIDLASFADENIQNKVISKWTQNMGYRVHTEKKLSDFRTKIAGGDPAFDYALNLLSRGNIEKRNSIIKLALEDAHNAGNDSLVTMLLHAAEKPDEFKSYIERILNDPKFDVLYFDTETSGVNRYTAWLFEFGYVRLREILFAERVTSELLHSKKVNYTKDHDLDLDNSSLSIVTHMDANSSTEDMIAEANKMYCNAINPEDVITSSMLADEALDFINSFKVVVSYNGNNYDTAVLRSNAEYFNKIKVRHIDMYETVLKNRGVSYPTNKEVFYVCQLLDCIATKKRTKLFSANLYSIYKLLGNMSHIIDLEIKDMSLNNPNYKQKGISEFRDLKVSITELQNEFEKLRDNFNSNDLVSYDESLNAIPVYIKDPFKDELTNEQRIKYSYLVPDNIKGNKDLADPLILNARNAEIGYNIYHRVGETFEEYKNRIGSFSSLFNIIQPNGLLQQDYQYAKVSIPEEFATIDMTAYMRNSYFKNNVDGLNLLRYFYNYTRKLRDEMFKYSGNLGSLTKEMMKQKLLEICYNARFSNKKSVYAVLDPTKYIGSEELTAALYYDYHSKFPIGTYSEEFKQYFESKLEYHTKQLNPDSSLYSIKGEKYLYNTLQSCVQGLSIENQKLKIANVINEIPGDAHSKIVSLITSELCTDLNKMHRMSGLRKEKVFKRQNMSWKITLERFENDIVNSIEQYSADFIGAYTLFYSSGFNWNFDPDSNLGRAILERKKLILDRGFKFDFNGKNMVLSADSNIKISRSENSITYNNLIYNRPDLKKYKLPYVSGMDKAEKKFIDDINAAMEIINTYCPSTINSSGFPIYGSTYDEHLNRVWANAPDYVYTADQLLKIGYFDELRFSDNFFGSNYVSEYNPAYVVMNQFTYVLKKLNAFKLGEHFMFGDNPLSLDVTSKSSIFKHRTDKEIAYIFSNNTDYGILTLIANKSEQGHKLAFMDITEKNIGIARARKYSVIVPYNVMSELSYEINNSRSRNAIINIFSKIVFPFKPFMLATMGFIFRNPKDALGKMLLETKDPLITFDAIKETIIKYPKYKEILKCIYKYYNCNVDLSSAQIKHWYSKPENKSIADKLNIDDFMFFHGLTNDGIGLNKFDVIKGINPKDRTLKNSSPLETLFSIMLKPISIEEQFIRTSQAYALRKLGHTTSETSKMIGESQFDYFNKSDADRVMELFIPFYSFMKQNLFFWIRAILDNPLLLRVLVKAFQVNEEAYDVDPYEYYNNQSIQYQIDNGNILLDPDTNLILKSNPSYVDAFNTLTNPKDAVLNKLFNPLKGIISVSQIEGVLSNGVTSSTDEDPVKTLISYFNPLKPFLQRIQTSKTNQSRIPDNTIQYTLSKYLPTVFGSVKRWTDYKSDKYYDKNNYFNSYHYRRYTYPKRSKNYYYIKQYINISPMFYYEQSLKQQKLRMRSNIKGVTY